MWFKDWKLEPLWKSRRQPGQGLVSILMSPVTVLPAIMSKCFRG